MKPKLDTKNTAEGGCSSHELLGREVEQYMQAVEKTLKSRGLPQLKSPKWEMVDDDNHYMTFAKEALSTVAVGDFENHAEMIDAWCPEMLRKIENAVAISKIREEMKNRGLTVDDLA